MERDSNTGKRKGEAQEHGESSANGLPCSIESEAFCCDDCTKILKPPIFQCPEGHFCCSSCRNYQLPDERCWDCYRSGRTATLTRSLGMDRVVQSILVDCYYAEHGYAERITLYDKDEHEKACSYARCLCPEPGCGFAGREALALDQLTAHHKWPLTTFQYLVPFDLRIVEPCTHVLHCKDDGQLLLVSVRPVGEPPGHAAVSIRCVRYRKLTWCSVHFKCSSRHHNTSSSFLEFGWPPTEYICVVPKVSEGLDYAGIVLRFNIGWPGADADTDNEDDDSDDRSYVQSDADDDDDSS